MPGQSGRTPSWEELLADPSLTFGEPGELLPHLLNFGKCYCAAAHVGPCGPPTAPVRVLSSDSAPTAQEVEQ